MSTQLAAQVKADLEAFRQRYGIDPLSVVYSTEDDALFGKLRMTIYTAVLGLLDDDPNADIDGYVQAWKEYWNATNN